MKSITICFVLAVFASGCSSVKPAVEWDDFGKELSSEYKELWNVRVAVGDVTISEKSDSTEDRTIPVNAESFREHYANALDRLDVFESVVTVGDTRETSKSKFLSLAKDEAADFLISLSVDRASLRFGGYENSVYASVPLWVLGGVLSWGVDDERFSIYGRLKADIVEVKTGKHIAEKRSVGVLSGEDSLSFFDRNSSILRYVISIVVPPMLQGADEDRVLGALFMPAMIDPTREIVRLMMDRGEHDDESAASEDVESEAEETPASSETPSDEADEAESAREESTPEASAAEESAVDESAVDERAVDEIAENPAPEESSETETSEENENGQ
ncbi:MAG: hypothetical protein NUW37_03745 [Planctomycetes bacterium]|nr:hypothetical protein [Planctomycetota bacterium]